MMQGYQRLWQGIDHAGEARFCGTRSFAWSTRGHLLARNSTQRRQPECIERRAHAATPQRQRSDWSKFKVPTIMTMRQPSEQTDCGSPQLSAECTDSPSVMDSMMELLASPFECLNSARRSLLVAPCKIEGAQKLWMRLELRMPLQVLVDGAGNGRPGWLRRALRMEIAGVLGIELHQARGESSRVHARDRSVRVRVRVCARGYMLLGAYAHVEAVSGYALDERAVPVNLASSSFGCRCHVHTHTYAHPSARC